MTRAAAFGTAAVVAVLVTYGSALWAQAMPEPPVAQASQPSGAPSSAPAPASEQTPPQQAAPSVLGEGAEPASVVDSSTDHEPTEAEARSAQDALAPQEATAEAVADQPGSTQESPDAPTAKDTEAEAAEQLAAELMMDEESNVVDLDEYKLNFYGFADFLVSQPIKDYGYFRPWGFFAVGRLNVYTSAELGDGWRTLLETRFTYLPHGSSSVQSTDSGPGATPINTLVTDYVDVDRPIRWGGTVIERAWLEYSYDGWLNVRMGHWLTPYGIWNVDHGSPVIIGVRRPFIVGESLFPESQSGLQVHGVYRVEPIRLGYTVTVSNGRGPADVYRDFDHNKAVGTRLFASYESASIGTLSLGTSTYYGKYTARTEQLSLTTVRRPITEQYDELSIAGDLKWTRGGALVQSEVIVHDTSYKNGTRRRFPGGYGADNRDLGAYVMGGYRFEFLGVMPWAGAEYYDEAASLVGAESLAFWGGLNFRPSPRVVLKAQYTYSLFLGDGAGADFHANWLDFQAAWSF